MLNTCMTYLKYSDFPDRQQVINKIVERTRDKLISSLPLARLEFLEYPHHKTAICILSKVANPDVVVIYTYGGLIPHHFHYTPAGKIADKTHEAPQFTWEWIEHWLNQNVAIAIFDVPDYFIATAQRLAWVNSFYRMSSDRTREAKQTIDLLSDQFPESKITWFGISYGALDAAMISLEDTKLYKIISASGTWHVIPDRDAYNQGGRLDWYDVASAKTPVLIVMHEKEVFDHARDQMTKTESLLVTNNVSVADGHFFRCRQNAVVTAMCDWYRDKPIPKIIL